MSDNIILPQIERLADLMQAHNYVLATAESCTGGGISQEVTGISGSSAWFDRGFVTYSNEAKQEMLSVPLDVLERFGAVSEECARAMVEGALAHSHADVAVSVTGIAGPGGGSEEKPVGTVCFGWAVRNKAARSTRLVFEGDRHDIRKQTILMALQGLLDLLED